MKSANHEFAILPWEYRGSGIDTTPHARTLLEIGGQKFKFHLKMRDGVIYFKIPDRTPIFAVIRQYNHAMRDQELIDAWRSEVQRQNFGRCYARPIEFQQCSGQTLVVSIIRADFSGWITDAFHLDWHEIPKHRDGRRMDIWKESVNKATWRAVLKIRDSFRDRIMFASERQPVESRWLSGDEAEVRHIFALVIQLYVRHSGTDLSRTWEFQAINTASDGGFLDSFHRTYNGDLQFSSALPLLLRLIKHHFIWVGMEWKRHTPKVWGENWRGSYSPVTPTLEITVPLVSSLSQHERLELSLELRDWLADKVSPHQSANLLAKALD